MLRKDELTFTKAISNIKLSPVFLRELRKTVATGKKKAIAVSKASAASASALERHSGVGGAARTSRESPQLEVSKRKAKELSTPDSPSEPAIRRHVPGHLFGDGALAQGTKGKLAAQSSRKFSSTEGGLAYAAVVAGRARPQQPSGPHNTPAAVSDHT
jgi:hypothetical protein